MSRSFGASVDVRTFLDDAERKTKGNQPSLTFAEGYMDLDLNRRYIVHRAATHLMVAPNNGLDDIHRGDVMIVDRSLAAKPGQVVLVTLDGEYAVRRLIKQQGRLWLTTDQPGDPLVPVQDMPGSPQALGVVTYSIHSHV
jgi:DNA polymerase V